MELRQLRTFVTITQTGSFSQAAEVLGYSQSAVTVQIRLLEEELGVKLFERMNRKVTLTPAGKAFLTHAGRIIYDMESAKESMKQEEELGVSLHIGTLESLCFSKLPKVLNSFRKKYPKVPVKITTASPKELIDMMDKNQLDFIYILDRKRYSDSWMKVLEEEEPIVFVASPLYGWGKRKKVQIDELLEEPFFLTEKDENYRRELDCFLETKRRKLTPFLEISNTEFILRMLEKNKGISYLPLFAVWKSVSEGKLTVLDIEELDLTMWCQVIYHKNKWVSQKMREFLRLIQDASEERNE